ncbi:MAG: metallophosphoesterase [Magnetococcales bacterium]|nr:metallophosphoesterase [Magnetococcales bacterium]MBF0583572.1 metallophosphoesterase [Magnetococcales bacterium]
MGHKNKEMKHEADRQIHTLVLSDTDNDLQSVRYALWLVGLCDRQGRWRKGIRHFCVIHTGDWLNKFNPNPEVLEFFQSLQASAPDSCSVVLLVGNHEVEILQRADAGVRMRLTPGHLAFIRRQDVLHVAGNILYLHGYPTLNLLALLLQIKQEEGGLNLFNERFRKAFYEGRYALFKNREGLEMVGDIRNVKQYYSQERENGEPYGVQISNLLQQLEIDTVIHGHRPNVLIQLDYEFYNEVPGIRIINNDNKASMTGFGAAVVDPQGYVRFINPKAMHVLGGEKVFRTKICRILGTGKAGLARRLLAGQEAVLAAAFQSEC